MRIACLSGFGGMILIASVAWAQQAVDTSTAVPRIKPTPGLGAATEPFGPRGVPVLTTGPEVEVPPPTGRVEVVPEVVPATPGPVITEVPVAGPRTVLVPEVAQPLTGNLGPEVSTSGRLRSGVGTGDQFYRGQAGGGVGSTFDTSGQARRGSGLPGQFGGTGPGQVSRQGSGQLGRGGLGRRLDSAMQGTTQIVIGTPVPLRDSPVVVPASEPQWHQGRWWFRQGNSWLYWSGNQWTRYEP
jgi:hypothetical protein